MTGIGIDTSGDVLSIAIARNGEIHYIEADAGLRHSERLMAMADALLRTAGITPSELEFVACMKGPGSFTGLRIGMASAKGMAVALGIPLFAIPTLEAVAAPRSVWPDTVLPLIDAKKNRWYTAAFRAGGRLCEDMDASAEDIACILQKSSSSAILVCGTDAPRAAVLLSAALPDARFVVDPAHRRGAARELVAAAAVRLDAGENGDADDVGLDYLRKSDAEITKARQREDRTR